MYSTLVCTIGQEKNDIGMTIEQQEPVLKDWCGELDKSSVCSGTDRQSQIQFVKHRDVIVTIDLTRGKDETKVGIS